MSETDKIAQLELVIRGRAPVIPAILLFDKTEQFAGRFERPEHNAAVHDRDPVVGFAMTAKSGPGLDGQAIQLPSHHHIVHYTISLAGIYRGLVQALYHK